MKFFLLLPIDFPVVIVHDILVVMYVMINQFNIVFGITPMKN